MLVGLLIAFFLSHKKIWALIYEEDGKTMVLFAGSAHKNKVGFERNFTTLVEGFN
jgi:cytochrome c biogenesis protein